MGASRERFEELVGEVLDELPSWVTDRMNNVLVLVEDEPPEDQPDLLGLYHGVSLLERGVHYSNVLPDTITLYEGPITRAAGPGERRLRGQIARTVAHEIAHHFGISDERLLEIDAY